MLFNQKTGWLLVVLALGLRGVGKGRPENFSLPGSTLLFAGDWNVAIVTPEATEVVPLPAGPPGHHGPSALPTLAPDGTLIASGFPVANDDSKRWKVRCAAAVYARLTKQWKTFGDFGQVYAGSLSPDGATLAFFADEGSRSTNLHKLLLLKLDSGEINELASIAGEWVSWSPDGQQLVLDTKDLEIFDLATRSMRKLAEGAFPAWSPHGTWIAYLASLGEEVHLIHPDGSGDQKVADVKPHLFSGDRSFAFAPVWSPDETKLLLNYSKGVNLTSRDVVLLDLGTRKMTTKLHNGDAIFGWASGTR